MAEVTPLAADIPAEAAIGNSELLQRLRRGTVTWNFSDVEERR
jgi:hypothetical protein